MQNPDALINGFKRFQRRYYKQDNSLYAQLREAQRPKVLVIGCSDSRVDPAILTDCQPGDLFVVRDVANLVPPYEKNAPDNGVSSAVEYAVRHLNVEHIVVLGHSHCGGIDALMHCDSDHPSGEFIDQWVMTARSARQKVEQEMSDKDEDQKVCACEQASILVSLENLMTFPWVAGAVHAGRLTLHGWYFDLDTGSLLAWNADTTAFEKLA
ncbi:MAG TPA: carbonic anhydrase [Phycisphaerales bacterium]|nr:carbonic anhydrase [Phycisphaerales bacterium]